MKNFIYSILMLSVFSSFLFAQGEDIGQQEKKMSFSLNSGFSFPAAPTAFKDGWKTGLNLGAGLGVRVSNNVVLQGTFAFNHFSLDNERPSNFEGGNLKTMNFFGNVRLDAGAPQPSKVIPYAIAGIGFTKVSVDDLTIKNTGTPLDGTYKGNKENAFIFGVGAGCDIGLTEKASLFIETRYAISFTEDEKTNYFPIKVGFSFR